MTCNSVRIGKNAIVGAGSVVTKDVPDNEIWAGFLRFCPPEWDKKIGDWIKLPEK